MSSSKHAVVHPEIALGTAGAFPRPRVFCDLIVTPFAHQCDRGGAAGLARGLLRPAALCVFAAALLSSCWSVRAQESQSGGETIGHILETLRLRQTPPSAADF